MARTKKRFCALEADTKETAAMHSAPGQWRTGLYARLSVDNAETGKDSIESRLTSCAVFFRESRNLRSCMNISTGAGQAQTSTGPLLRK